jgi:hypothetical protein
MSTVIDQNIVEMRFDNGQFERGVTQSMSSIDKLKSSLNFTNVAKEAEISLGNVGNTVSDLASFLEHRFSFIGEAMMGLKFKAAALTKELTVDNIATGWNKYAEITSATQTIMAATRQDWEDQGAQMEYVNERLEKLNWFTDETSYSLTDMTGNIGKFTSAGIDLDKSTEAMMGIATWAGISGAGVAGASRAMYNLSQSMSMGAVQLKDWMSIENANMATREFKQAAIDTAVELGTLKKTGADTYKTLKGTVVTIENFRETLNSKAGNWFNADVLTTTLKKYGDFASEMYTYTEATGMSTSQLLKYIKQAKDGLINIEDADAVGRLASSLNVDVDSFSEALTKLSDDYYDLGMSAFIASQEAKTFQEAIDYTKDAAGSAWMNTFRTIFGDYMESKELWTAVTEEIYDVLLEDLDNQNNVLKEWKELGGRNELAEAVGYAWGNVKEVIMSVKETFKDIFPPATGETLLKITERFKNFAYISELTEHRTEKLRAIFKDFFDGIKTLGKQFSTVWNWVLKEVGRVSGLLPKDLFKDGGIIDWLGNIVKSFKDLIVANDLLFSNNDRTKQAISWGGAIVYAIKAIKTAVSSIINIFKAVGLAFLNIFPHEGAGPLIAFTDLLNNLANIFRVDEERASKLQRLFEGLFAVLDIGKMLLQAILSLFVDFTDESDNLADGLFDGAAAFGDWLVSIRDWLKENNTFQKAADAIFTFFKELPGKIDNVVFSLTGMHLDEIWAKIKETASDAWSFLKDMFANMKEDFASFGALFKKNNDDLEETGEKANVFDTLRKHLDSLKKGLEVLKPYIDEFFETFKQGMSELSPVGEWIKNNLGDTILKGGIASPFIAIAIAIMRFLNLGKTLKKEGKNISAAIQGMFNSVSNCFKELQQNIKAKTFKTIASAILEIAAAIFLLALLPEEKLAASTIAVTFMMTELALCFGLISRTNTSEKKLKQIKGMMGMLELIIATFIGGIYLLATQTDMNSAIASTLMLGILMIEVMAFFKVIDTMKMGKNYAEKIEGIKTVMLTMAVLIAAMGASILLASKQGDPEAIGMAGLILIGLLGEIILLAINLNKAKITEKQASALSEVLKSVSLALIAIGAAVAIMTFGGSDWKTMGTAGIVLAGMLFAIAGAVRIMPDTKKLKETAGGLALIGLALLLMGAGIALVANSGDWKSIAAAGVVLAGMIVAIAFALNLMNGDGVLKSAGALAIVAVGVLALATALAVINGIGDNIGMVLLSLAVGLAAVLVAGFVAGYVAVGLVALGVAISLIGAGAMMAGAGLWLFAQGIATLAAIGPDEFQNLTDAIYNFFLLFPELMTNIGQGIVNFIQVLVDNQETITEGFVALFTGFLTAVDRVLPKILETVGIVLVAVIDLLITLVPKVLELVQTIFVGLVDLFWQQAPEIVAITIFLIRTIFGATIMFINEQAPVLGDTLIMLVQIALDVLVQNTLDISMAAINILIGILNLILENIGEVTAIATAIAIEIALGFIDGITQELDDIIQTGINFVLALLNGLADGIRDNAEDFRAAMENLANSLLEAFCTVLGIKPGGEGSDKFSNTGKDIVGGIISGIGKKAQELWDTMKNLGESIINGFRKGIEKVSDVCTNAAGTVVNGVVNIARGNLDEHSPSKVFEDIGENVDLGFANGLEGFATTVFTATEGLTDGVIDTFSTAIGDITDLFNFGELSDPTISPVLDLSNFSAGIGEMNAMLPTDSTVEVAGYAGGGVNNSVSRRNSSEARLSDMADSISEMNANQGDTTTTNNTFNITGDDPKAIANEVSRILNGQVERRGAAWA